MVKVDEGLVESRSYRPWTQFLPSVVRIFFRLFGLTRLPDPIPTPSPVTLLQNVCPAVDPTARRHCLPGGFQSSAAPPFGYHSSSRDPAALPLVKTVPV